MATTIIAAARETQKIFRWVARSAVYSEEFTENAPELSFIGRAHSGKGSLEPVQGIAVHCAPQSLRPNGRFIARSKVMIIQTAPAGGPRLAIMMHEHTALCGQFARVFGNDRLEPVAPLDLMIYVIS